MADRPWIMRTYSGHSTARESNALYREGLARGQTGLSIAFDLPTQCGYDSDHPLARGEVGKVGVPNDSIDDMELLLDGIPLGETNTSMTINAPAAWLLALYVAVAERQGVDRASLRGTTQNDVVKEYLSRGTWIFPPEASLRLTTDIIEFTVAEIPKWNPINICSYHLQEAGATPVQEVAYTLATAISVLDAIKVPADVLPRVVGRIAFFCNSGIRFIEEMCKMRVFDRLWDRITRERYGVEDPKLRRFRYGVQVNSLGLTAEQPENNIPRIVLESLGVLLSRDARARALQLPAWNEALGLPEAWDQQWSLRIQQILAHETDLLEYPDLFEGSVVIEQKVRELEEAAWAEIERIDREGGAIPAVREGSMKRAMVESNRTRLRAIEQGEKVVVGVNRYEDSEASPLVAHGKVVTPTEASELEQVDSLESRRKARDQTAVDGALGALRDALEAGTNVMPASIRCAHAGVTTGEWTDALRESLGEYRPPTGLDVARPAGSSEPRAEQLRRRVDEISHDLGRRLKLLVGKPGLDGHSNGAELLALAARDAGLEVVYAGIRQTPDELIAAAIQEGVHLVGLSVLSGSHMALVPRVVDAVDVPVVVGGIIPEADATELRDHGVAAVYTPRDHDLSRIVGEMIEIAAKGRVRV